MRRAAILLLLLALGAAPGRAQADPEIGGVAFLQVVTAGDVYYLNERISVVLRLGYDAEFFRQRAVRLFRQELDLQVQLEVPWLQGPAGTRALPPLPAGPGPGRTLVLNGAVVRARPAGTEEAAGRRYTVLEIERSYLAERVGELLLGPATLRFAFATRFEEDLIKGRVAADRRPARIVTKPVRLRIDPLPESGRPPCFTGAVGRFSVAATVDRRELTVGESVHLTLRVTGRGNLEGFGAPALGVLEGLHHYGLIERIEGTTRCLVYDLVPSRAGTLRVPPIPFAYFHRELGYRIVRTEAASLRVLPLPAGATLRHLPGETSRAARAGVNDIHGIRRGGAPGATARELPGWLVGLGLFGPWLLAGALYAALRAREKALSDPAGRRARAAAERFAAALAGGPTVPLQELLADYLAARLRCSTAAVIAPDLPVRLEGAGVPATLAGRTGSVLTGLTAARFGGAPAEADAERVRELVGELEARFLSVEEGER